MGSKLISVIVSLMVVLGVLLVPAVPVANVALANPGNEWGIEFQPSTVAVAPSSSFVARVYFTQLGDRPTDGWDLYVTFNNSMLNATGISIPATLCDGNAPSLNPGVPEVNNTGGYVYHSYSETPPINNCTNSTWWYANISFDTLAIEGVTHVLIDQAPPFRRSRAISNGHDVTNTSALVNLTVTISSGAECCAEMNGQGNVSIDGNVKTPPGGCEQSGDLNHTFALLATPHGGWQFDNWSGNVDGAVTDNPNNITINNGASENVTANFSELAPVACVSTNLLDFGDLYVGGSNPANKTFDVINCGGGLLDWSSNLTYVAWPSGNVTLAYGPQNGTGLANASSDTVDVAINISGATGSDAGTYTANISVNPNVTVTFDLLPPTTIVPCRNITLPHVTGLGQPYIYEGESFTVNVSWTTCAAGNVSSVSLVDNTTVTNATGVIFYWNNVVQVSENPPADAEQVRGTGNTSVEYVWYSNYTPGTNMSVNYTVTVPLGTAPGWYNMTVCPDNSTAFIAYAIGEQVFVHCIDCDFQIYVAAPVYVEGTVWEVVWNWVTTHPLFTGGYHDVAGNLTLTGVNVTMVDTVTYYNISNATGYYNISVAPGNYTLSASFAPAFAAETYGWVNLTGAEGVVTIDFIGVNGLEPFAPFYVGNSKGNMAVLYVTKAVNCYLVTPSVPAAALTMTEVGNVTAMWLATP